MIRTQGEIAAEFGITVRGVQAHVDNYRQAIEPPPGADPQAWRPPRPAVAVARVGLGLEPPVELESATVLPLPADPAPTPRPGEAA